MTPHGSPDGPTFRITRIRRPGEVPKGYVHTMELRDETEDSVLAKVDVVGRAVFAHSTIRGADGETWHLAPNRKVLPTRWTLTDSDGAVLVHFDQQVIGKLFNPLFRTLLVLLDASDSELARVIDPTTSTPAMLFGLGPTEWALIRDDELLARLRYLPPSGPIRPGLLGRVQRFLNTSDRGIVSVGNAHALSAPVALALQVLFDPLTEASG